MGLVTSKTAEATYQPKSLMGNYVTQGELKNFEDRYGDEIKKFTESTYQPKASYVSQGELKKFEDRFGDELKRFSAAYQPKGDYITSPFKPLPEGNGGYMTASKTYDIGKALKRGDTVGNAIVSSEDYGSIGLQSLDGTGKGSQLFATRDKGLMLQYLSGNERQESSIGVYDERVTLKGNKYCFGNTCFTEKDMQTLQQNLPRDKGLPTQYLRTRNYMDY